MNPQVLDYPTLQAVTGYQRQADVERCLAKAGIRFFYARSGVWTTLDLVNAAGGLKQAGNSDTYQPSDLF
jgi:hypothetical protein